MMANSILSNLTAENTVAEIRLLLSADIKKKRTVALFEGEDDIKVFRFLLSPNVTLIKAYGASTTVDKLIPKNFPNEPRVIGIRDKDYQEKKLHDKIFYCDNCNCEMMLVSDDETMEKLVANFYRGQLSGVELRKEILRKLYYISIIRLCSDRYRWGLRMSDTDLAKVCAPNVSNTRSSVIDFVNSYNRRNTIDVNRERKLKNYHDSGRLQDYLQITNGHDFVEVLRVYCVYAQPSHRRALSDKIISGALRCSYSLSAFRKTSLFAQLVEYGNIHGLSIVKN